MRVADLAALPHWERSRVSRLGCPEDGRGAFVRIAETGQAAIERAAPGHARTVRRLVFDALTADEVVRLDEIFHRLRSRAGLSAD
ncbi:hypothetical protein [Amycolatopsis coloradensis]|uniref:hypothetical protein n=1 Tax=Amycolatopsis coloradensis TaxID=76021 RepID=UPI001ABEED00|nr:hypothetical protein [Amycolatopsis coloradensis]